MQSKKTRKFDSRLPTALLVLFGAAASFAATFDVADGDVPGLKAAIHAANASPGSHVINLAANGTYTLTAADHNTGNGYFGYTGLPLVTSPITIAGNGATIERSNAVGIENFRILAIASPDATLNEVTIRGGTGAGLGAGMLIVGPSSNVRLTNSTVSGNGLGGEADGGGICNYYGRLTVINSTLTQNRSYGGFGGGGILTVVGQTTMVNSTIYENRADGPPGFQGRGDAIAAAFSSPGSVVLKNSVVASPTQGLGNDCYGDVVASLGHNIASDGSCVLAGIGDLNSTNPLLGPHADNGGPTLTNALLFGSPAVDAVPLSDCTDTLGSPVATDQRGVSRPQANACDIGAYEAAPFVIPVLIDIKPGSFPNSINPRSKGNIPVAILTTDQFDATTVLAATVRFGRTGTEATAVRHALEDVDADADLDMLLFFRTQETGIECGDVSASLTGEVGGGGTIEGSDSIVTVGCH